MRWQLSWGKCCEQKGQKVHSTHKGNELRVCVTRGRARQLEHLEVAGGDKAGLGVGEDQTPSTLELGRGIETIPRERREASGGSGPGTGRDLCLKLF